MTELMAEAHPDALRNSPDSAAGGPLAVWSPARKVAFRFLFCYIALLGTFCLNFAVILNVFGLTGRFAKSPLDRILGVVVPFVARYIFRLKDFRFQALTSGDSMSDYLEVFTYFLIALIVTIAWSLLRRKTTNYSRLSQWLRLYAQLVFAATLFTYGFDKVFPLQFGDLSPTTLVTTVGDHSHFSMLWDFMAASKPYTIFSGVLELLAGIMLVTPKLRSAGALLAIAVMTSVFALNVFYDVPVKLFSLELLLLAVYLAAPDFPRLLRLLVLNRAVEPRNETPLSDKQRVGRWAVLAQGGLAACFFAAALLGSAQLYAKRQAEIRNVPLAGVWDVDQFQLDGNSQPLLTTKLATEMHVEPGEDRWTKFIVGSAREGVIQLHNGVWDYVGISVNKDHTQLDVDDSADATWKVHFAIQQPGGNLLRLQGTINGVPVEIALHANDKSFRLTSEKYHIIRNYQ